MRVKPVLFLLFTLLSVPAFARQESQSDSGVPVTDATTRAACQGCHKVDDKGRMTRISYVRTTPEGWQEIIKRMIRNNGVQLEPTQARNIVKYLSNNHGLTPAEARIGFYENEKRVVLEKIPTELDQTCRRCHTLGRILTQRRTREDWQLLANMHVAVFPLSEGQGSFVVNPTPSTPIIAPTLENLNREADSTHPGPIPTAPPEMTRAAGGGDPNAGGLDRALNYLSANLGLDSPAFNAWRASFRYPRLEGTWIVEAYLPGKGRGFGQMTIQRETAEDEYTTRTTLEFADGEKTTRTGKVLLYGGYSWRGTSTDAAATTPQVKDLREVMLLSDDLEAMRGRWFSGAYDEYGMDVQVRKAGRDIILSSTDRARMMSAKTSTVKVYGANFPTDLRATDVDFGPGTTVSNLRTTAGMLTVDVAVNATAAVGFRDILVRGKIAKKAIAVFDKIDYIRILPEQGMARLGGVSFPKGFQQFDAVAYHNGPDKKANTADDVELGNVPVNWSIEEFPVTIDDDDAKFVGKIDPRGLFTPNVEGPNPERSGSRNNLGDVRIIGSYSGDGTPKPLKGSSHLIVTVPLYVRWAQMEIFRP